MLILDKKVSYLKQELIQLRDPGCKYQNAVSSLIVSASPSAFDTCLVSLLEHLEHRHLALCQLSHPNTQLVLERCRQTTDIVQIEDGEELKVQKDEK